MDCKEQRCHARAVHSTQYTSRMGTEMVKHEEEAHKNNVRIVRNLEEWNVSTKEESQTRPN